MTNQSLEQQLITGGLPRIAKVVALLCRFVPTLIGDTDPDRFSGELRGILDPQPEASPAPAPSIRSPDLEVERSQLLPDISIDETRRNLVIRALEFAAHGHGELPTGFTSDAVDCLTGVLRDSENNLLAFISEWRDAVERASGVEADPVNHTPAWAYERVLAKREIGNGVRNESGDIAPSIDCARPELGAVTVVTLSPETSARNLMLGKSVGVIDEMTQQPGLECPEDAASCDCSWHENARAATATNAEADRDHGIIRAAEGVTLEPGEYEDANTGAPIRARTPITAVMCAHTRGGWAFALLKDLEPVTAVRRVEAKTEPLFGVWCERPSELGFWRSISAANHAPLRTTRADAERRAENLNRDQCDRKDSVGWVYSAREFVEAKAEEPKPLPGYPLTVEGKTAEQWYRRAAELGEENATLREQLTRAQSANKLCEPEQCHKYQTELLEENEKLRGQLEAAERERDAAHEASILKCGPHRHKGLNGD